ncbi:hypothetical protein D3C75_959190 [compost metagenome]
MDIACEALHGTAQILKRSPANGDLLQKAHHFTGTLAESLPEMEAAAAAPVLNDLKCNVILLPLKKTVVDDGVYVNVLLTLRFHVFL